MVRRLLTKAWFSSSRTGTSRLNVVCKIWGGIKFISYMELHVKFLEKDASAYTSHTWRRSAATNLADARVNFIFHNRHGQWISYSVMEGYIANSKPLRDERLHCLMLSDMRPKKMTEGRVVLKKKMEAKQQITLQVLLLKSTRP